MKVTNRKRKTIFWVNIIIVIVLGITACNSQKRITKELQKLDQEELNKIRAWPYNYTYFEYTSQLDEAKLRIEFFKKRKLQAKIANDMRTVEVMKRNILTYEEKEKRLEKDKKFYKIYKLREREIKAKLKADQQAQSDISNQKKKLDKAAKERRKDFEDKQKERTKNRENATNEKLDKLEEKQKVIEDRKEIKDDLVSEKEKEKAKLQKQMNKAPEDDKGYYQDEIDYIDQEIKEINESNKANKKSLDSINFVIEEFMELNFSTDSTTNEQVENEAPSPYSIGPGKKKK